MGLFGLLGQGNVGNDGSAEAVLSYLRTEHPDLVLDFFCTGPEQMSAKHRLPSSPMRWYAPERHPTSGLAAVALKIVGKIVDAFRTASWVRRHDVVVVPGMGVLEATVPQRPMQTPYAMFLLCASGRLFRTKVALVSVGSDIINVRLTRWFTVQAARLAYYRSYRDVVSKESLQRMGLDTSRDPVYPDVVFSLPTPPVEAVRGTIGVGLMDYRGGNDDRKQAAEIRSGYVSKMTSFLLWLLDNDRHIRLLTGDIGDEGIVQEVLADLTMRRPSRVPAQVVAEPVASFTDLMEQMASVDTVIATRFHNAACAVKLGKPTLAVGYSVKHKALLDSAGLSGFFQSVKSLDLDQLIDQFTELERRSHELRQTVTEYSSANAQLVRHQFEQLSALIYPEEKRDRRLRQSATNRNAKALS